MKTLLQAAACRHPWAGYGSAVKENSLSSVASCASVYLLQAAVYLLSSARAAWTPCHQPLYHSLLAASLFCLVPFNRYLPSCKMGEKTHARMEGAVACLPGAAACA